MTIVGDLQYERNYWWLLTIIDIPFNVWNNFLTFWNVGKAFTFIGSARILYWELERKCARRRDASKSRNFPLPCIGNATRERFTLLSLFLSLHMVREKSKDNITALNVALVEIR